LHKKTLDADRTAKLRNYFTKKEPSGWKDR
jgi:hypothetical protein